jgi:hypothetical protein
VATLLSLVVTVLLLSRGVLRGTRLTAIAAVTSLVLTWGFAQRPYLLPTTLTIQDGAGDPNSLRWLVIVTAVAVLLVGPALALLYRLDLTDRLAADHDEDLVEARRSLLAPDPATSRTRGRENRAERPDSPRAQLRNAPTQRRRQLRVHRHRQRWAAMPSKDFTMRDHHATSSRTARHGTMSMEITIRIGSAGVITTRAGAAVVIA